jgi:hypothetical protein
MFPCQGKKLLQKFDLSTMMCTDMSRLQHIFASILLIFLIGAGFSVGNETPVRAISSYSRTITVTNTGAAVTNWAINVYPLDTLTIIAAGKMRLDCGDIRVFDSTGTSLPYWLDSGCNTFATTIWFRAASIPAGTSTFTLQYGDGSLTSQSNPVAVLDKYDDMQSAPGCTVSGNTANTFYDGPNKRLQLTSAAGNQFGSCTYTLAPSDGFYSRFLFQSGTGNGADATWFFAYNATGPGVSEDEVDGGYHFTFDEYQAQVCYTKSTTANGPGITCSAQATIGNNVTHKAEIYHSGLNAKILYDGTQVVNANDTVANAKTNTKFGVAARTGGQNNRHLISLALYTRYTPLISLSISAENTAIWTLSLAIRNTADTASLSVCDLGTASPTAFSQCAYRLKIATNIPVGYRLYVQTSGNLSNGSKSLTNAGVGTGGAGGSLISVATTGVERYGVLLSPGSLTSGAAITRPAAYDAGVANSVTFAPVVPTLLLTAAGTNAPAASGDTTNTLLFQHNLNISSATVGGAYTQSVTYTVISNF